MKYEVNERAGKHTHTRTAGQYMTHLIEATVTASKSRQSQFATDIIN